MTIKLEEQKKELEITLVIRVLVPLAHSPFLSNYKLFEGVIIYGHGIACTRIVNEYRLHATTWNRLQQASLCLFLSSVLSVCGV